MIKKILIANRGEIAVRIIKTCKKLNILTIAIYSDADKNSLYTKMADEKYSLDSDDLADSYLNIGKIIAIAKKSNSCAIHPGYGFLSENSEFAKEVEQNNIIFIGPNAKAIEQMGVKSVAKDLAKQAGMPVLENYDINSKNIKYPVLIKAAYGGGGKGMRIVTSSKDLKLSIEAAKREALKSFGNDEIIIEQYIENSRHIEVQVLFDQHGNSVYLFERDCSIQRRYQKIIEEAPAPNLPEDIEGIKFRDIIGEKSLDVAKSVDYTGVGTVELLFDIDSNNFYFMEMNTRLQVEHPVTELITGIDLVEEQINVANGNKIKFRQNNLSINGHAVEVRIYAEDVNSNFLPSTGKILYSNLLNDNLNNKTNIRIDSGIEQNNDITIKYDPLLAKVIAWGDNREEAINNVIKTLSKINLIGLKTNIVFLLYCLRNKDFVNINLSSSFVNNNLDNIISDINNDIIHKYYNIALAMAGVFYNSTVSNSNISSPPDSTNPWQANDSWRSLSKNRSYLKINFLNNNIYSNNIILESASDKHSNSKAVHIYQESNIISIGLDNICLNKLNSKIGKDSCYEICLSSNNIKYNAKIIKINNNKQNNIYVYLEGLEFVFTDQYNYVKQGVVNKDSLTAPMPGTVVSINVKNGAKVNSGDILLILEAMKMEHTIIAPKAGTVKNIHYDQGQQVELGAELLVVE